MWWLIKMAWRDSRRSRSRLLLFISSIVLGIAALVAINSFRINLEKDISREAKSLIGADLIIQGNQPIPDSIKAMVDTLEAEHSDALNFVSMVYFPKNEGTRLAQIKAFNGNFPYYGTFATEPKEAVHRFRKGKKALVEKTLMIQYDLQLGDFIQVGELTFQIEGILKSAPGRTGFAGAIAPVVYIPMQYLESTGLVQQGSRIFYQYYYKIKDNFDIAPWAKNILQPRLKETTLSYETIDSRKESLGEAFSQLANFLNLVGFIALILGCIGVASAIHVYIKDKLKTVAVLRCLGASGKQAFFIFLIQIGGMGLFGAIIGAILGSLLQVALPVVLGDFLPLQNVSADISWSAIIQGILIGLSIAMLFALLPLLSIRKTSPLLTLRASFEKNNTKRDPVKGLVYGLIIAFIGGFAFYQTKDATIAIAFIFSIIIAFILLAGVARLLTWTIRKFFPSHWNFIWRQSIANLFRPNNQTHTLMVAIGLGTLLISNLFIIQNLLLDQVAFTTTDDQPNMILFDIQSKQKDDVVELTKNAGLPLIQEVPIVTIRVENIDGVNKTAYLKDTASHVSEWIYDREFRVTYRDTMIDTEEIISGEWHGNKANNDSIYISISETVAEDMDAKIGTKMAFNVQGAIIETVVSSIRKVNFNKVATNFFIVFPTGVLEQAPQFHVIVTRTPSVESSAHFQRDLVKSFPNISVIDLTQILKTIETILNKVSFVIRFMALFSILTGFLVLISSVAISKYQRIKESVLLRTIGANRQQILLINALEYFFLGSLAALTGILLSFIAGWIIATFQFEIPFTPSLIPAIILFFSITFLTVLIGMLNSRRVLNQSPLEVLRQEV